MPESPENANPLQPKPKKEMTMESRLLVAFLLMGLILLLTPYFYKPPAPPKAKTGSHLVTAPPEKPAPKVVAPPETPPAKPVPPAPAEQIAATQEQPFVIDTDLYRIQFSNRGAVVKSWLLKKYKDQNGKALELVDEAALGEATPPFALVFSNEKISSDPNTALFQAKPTPDGLGIDYEYSDGHLWVHKSFRFSKTSYLSTVTTEAKLDGGPAPHLISWRGGFGDMTVPNPQSVQHSLYYDVTDKKLRTKNVKDAKKGTVTVKGDYSFAGLEDTFFAAVFLPKEGTSTELETYSNTLKIGTPAKEEPRVGMGVGGDAVNHFSLFVGPKDVDILGLIDPRLKQLINWGFFGVVAKPMFYCLQWMNNTFVHNYGWSIVLLTIGINLLVFPLRFTSLKSSKKMQALQPEIKAINAKYKGLKLNDPKKTEQNQEVMALYKKHGVNPVSGCLPMLIQLPLLYAIYEVLAVAIEMRGAHWLWVTDLSQPEHLALHVLPIVMIVTQFFMQKMTPNPSVDQSQQKIMMIMPLAFGFFFYNLASGLVLYYLTSNLVGIVQQWFINRLTPAPVMPVEPPKTPKKRPVRA